MKAIHNYMLIIKYHLSPLSNQDAEKPMDLQKASNSPIHEIHRF